MTVSSRFLARLAIALAASMLAGCNGSNVCAPDSSPSCECNPGDNQLCTTNAGAQGLQVCSMQGQWGDCAPFSDDGGIDAQEPPDVMIFDTNYSYQ